MEKTLHIVIKRKYFDQIVSGTKTQEFRLVKPYWVNKLVDKDYTHIIFQAGYRSDAPRYRCAYNGYDIINLRHEFFGDAEVTVFALNLGHGRRIN